MGLKESGLRGSLRSVSTGVRAIPDSVVSDADGTYWASDLDANDGDSITDWPDYSDAGNDISGGGPVYKSDVVNGEPVVRFDGTDDVLSESSVSNSFPFTQIAIFQTDNPNSGQTAIGQSDSDNIAKIGTGDSDVGYSTRNGNDFAASNELTTDWKVLIGVHESSETTIRVNGNEFAGTSDSETGSGISVGASRAGDFGFIDGDIAFASKIPRLLDSSEVDEIEQWASDTYGITL